MCTNIITLQISIISFIDSPVDNLFTNGMGNWKSADFVQRTGPGPYSNVGPREGVIDAGNTEKISFGTFKNKFNAFLDSFLILFSRKKLVFR